MTTYYRVDGGQLTYAEYWRMSPGLFPFLVAAGLKFLGSPIPFTFAVPRPDRLFLVEFDELPAVARQGMKRAVHRAEAAGLELVFCHRLAVPEPHRLGAAAVFLDSTGETTMSVLFAQEGATRQSQLSCVSRFADESLGCTTTVRKSMEVVPGTHVERYPGADPAALLARHRDHLGRLEGEGLVPVPIAANRLADFVLACEVRYVDFHIGRGVFVPMTDDELDAISGPRG
jgi:hypothetical protein